jgi:Icc protein
LSACLDQHGLRTVEIEEEQVRVSAIDITEPGVLDTAPTIYKYMKHFTHNPEARGEQADRECVVSLMTAATS